MSGTTENSSASLVPPYMVAQALATGPLSEVTAHNKTGSYKKTEPPRKPIDKWIPWFIVLFNIVLVLVLVPMCYLAIKTYTGVVTTNPYEKGLAYNKAIAATEEQSKLGWNSQFEHKKLPDGQSQFTLALKDKEGAVLPEGKAEMLLMRPTQDGMDKTVALTFQNGTYTANVKLPLPGIWDARISVFLNGHNFQFDKRVVVQD